jgi:hypothetical protein
VTEQPQGRYRTPGEKDGPNTAFVEIGRVGIVITEQEYRERGYEPDFDELPLKIDYCPVDAKHRRGQKV